MDRLTMDKCLTEMQISGSEMAFENLYNESGRGVFSFIYSFVNNYFDAEDVFQMTFISIRRNVDSYKSGSNAVAWVLEIAKNNALNFLKKRDREVAFTACGEKANSFAAEEPEIGENVISIIKDNLDDISSKIVIMRLVTGLKHREIAKALNLPLGTVLWKYNKAIKLLREVLKKELYED